jgi:hypothetical protein
MEGARCATEGGGGVTDGWRRRHVGGRGATGGGGRGRDGGEGRRRRDGRPGRREEEACRRKQAATDQEGAGRRIKRLWDKERTNCFLCNEWQWRLSIDLF